MLPPRGGAKAIVLPAVISCTCLLHLLSADDVIESASLPESPRGLLAEELTEFFKSLVRKRRQLPRRIDLDKKGFTDVEKQAMLTLHNAHRSTVDPTAANMIEVRWNDRIEAFAQEWSENCAFEHRDNRNLGSWINMGENIFFTTGNRYTEKIAVDSWWNEYRDYIFETKECAPGKQCGHYITAAWASTEFIGCGITRCDNLTNIGDYDNYLFVCNYSGRFFSHTRPYEEGTSCSNCPLAYPRCRHNLCVTENMLNGCVGYNGTTIYISATRNVSVSDPMDCPGFVDNDLFKTDTPDQGTTQASNATTTDAGGGSGNMVYYSIPNLFLCAIAFFSLKS